MDSIKGQDVAIRALAHLAKSQKGLKMLLIGNGSFSGSSKGGLAHPKSSLWKQSLQKLTRELNLEDRVIFAGYRPPEYVRAAYSLSDCTLLPSRAEGFGLTTIESWVYKRPVVVSKGAGSSELVIDGMNGYSFTSGDDTELASKIEKMLGNPEAANKMGESGYDSTNFCDIDRNIASLSRVFEETLHYFG